MIIKKQIRTRTREEILDISPLVREAVQQSGVQEGICVVFVPHTTCAVTINENADADVKRDILWFLKKLIPQSREFRHAEENSDAHLKTMFTGNSATLLIDSQRPLSGTWQGIYFCEYDGPRTRNVIIKVLAG